MRINNHLIVATDVIEVYVICHQTIAPNCDTFFAAPVRDE